MKEVDNRMAKLDNRDQEKAKKAAREEAKRQARLLPMRDYVAMTCANCGSALVRTTRSEQITDVTRKRHHKCTVCNREWESFEETPLVDRDSTDKKKLKL